MKRTLSLLMALCLAVGILQLPALATEAPPADPVAFTDVAETDWFYQDVNTVAAAGLMEGVGEGRFNPEGQLSWIEAVIIAVRAYEYNNGGIVTGADPVAPEAPSAPEGEPPAMPEGEAPAMPEGEVPAEGGGNGTGSPEDMVASYVVNADGTVAVTLSGIEMDTYSVNGTAAAGGQTVTVTPSADGTITVSFTGGGGPYLGVADYVFTPEAGGSAPEAAEPAAPAEPETTGDWTTPYIQAAIAHGIVDAAPENVYVIISRAEAAVIFAAALPAGEPVNQLPADFFTDVPADSPAYEAVYALAAAGIVQGTGENGAFGADLSFQRHSLAAIAARMCGLVDRVTITVPVEPPAEGGEGEVPPEGGEPPAEGGGDGTAASADMVSSYEVNADGTVAVTLAGMEMDTYTVNGTAAKGGETVTVAPAADGTITVSFTGGGGPYLGVADYVFTPEAGGSAPEGGEPPAAPVVANFDGYKTYLITCAETLWPGDAFLTNVYNEVGAMTEDNYASQMMYTILVNDMGCLSYDAWLAQNS